MLSALRAHTESPCKPDLLWETRRALNRPGRARAVLQRRREALELDARQEGDQLVRLGPRRLRHRRVLVSLSGLTFWSASLQSPGVVFVHTQLARVSRQALPPDTPLHGLHRRMVGIANSGSEFAGLRPPSQLASLPAKAVYPPRNDYVLKFD